MSNKVLIAKVRSFFEHALYNGFNKGYHSVTNIVKDKKYDMVPDDHSILASCRNYFSRLLNLRYMESMVLGRLKKYIPHSRTTSA